MRSRSKGASSKSGLESSPRDKDNFRAFGIKTEKRSKISAPLIAGSYANLEGMMLTSYPASNYILYLVELVAFKGNEKLVPLAWLKDSYFSLDREAR
jgi:flavin reductase (DIM6/NTAB) family NADH-FMN oxidoreductase RutF